MAGTSTKRHESTWFVASDPSRLFPALLAGVMLHAGVAALCALQSGCPQQAATARLARPADLVTIDVAAAIPAGAPESPRPNSASVANRSGHSAAAPAHRVRPAAARAPVPPVPQPTVPEGTETEPVVTAGTELASNDEGAGTVGLSAGDTAAGGGSGGLGGTASGAGSVARKPSLLAALPCNGFFPYRAPHDAATVNVAIAVNASGAPISVRVESEAPRGEGFGNAAESCVKFARFRPATNADGGPIAAIARLELTFKRTR